VHKGLKIIEHWGIGALAGNEHLHRHLDGSVSTDGLHWGITSHDYRYASCFGMLLLYTLVSLAVFIRCKCEA